MTKNPEKSPIHFREYKQDKGTPEEQDILEITLEDQALQILKEGQGFMAISKRGGMIIIKGPNFQGKMNTVAREDLAVDEA